MRSILKLYYLKYKKQIFPTLLISLSFFIVFRVIIPQFASISESNQIISDKSRETNTLKETLNIISVLNEANASSNLSATTKALPTAKDITVIFSALTSAASISEVDLKEFSLKVGGLYGRAARGAGTRGAPMIEVVARITSSDPENFVKYAGALQARLPLSEIKSIDVNGNIGTYELGFYYKPLDLTLVSKQDKVTPLNQNDLNLINQLKEWDQ